MTINWFPGHMVTARKDAVDTMRNTDVVIEVLDARVPFSSSNPMFETLRRENQRPALKILNKTDLADPVRTQEWLDWYNAKPGVSAIALSAKSRGDVARIPDACALLAPSRDTLTKPLRMMILGVPNVGKSTLMNTLLQRRLATVGDEPAITKQQMRHEIGPGRSLVDTPGMMWPGAAQDAARKLAITHSIGRNAYDDESAAHDLAAVLLERYRPRLLARYGPDLGSDSTALLTAIARARNLVARGSQPDVKKAAAIFLNDFRAGTLGPITLETCEEIAALPHEPQRAPRRDKKRR